MQLDNYIISLVYTWYGILNFLAAWRMFNLRKTAVVSYRKMLLGYALFHICLAIPLIHAAAAISLGHYGEYQWIFAVFMFIGSLVALWSLF